MSLNAGIFSNLGTLDEAYYSPDYLIVANDGTGNYNCDGVNDENQIIAALNEGPTVIKYTTTPYEIDASITLDPYDILIGSGGMAGSPRLDLNFDGVMFDTASDQVNTGIVMRNLRLNGNRTARGAGTGIRWYGVYLGQIENMYVHDFDDYGFYFDRETNTNKPVAQCKISNVEMINAGVGSGGWYNNYIADCRINNIGIGFTITGARSCIQVVNNGSGCCWNNIHVWGDVAGVTTGINLSADTFYSVWNNIESGGVNMDHAIAIANIAWGHVISNIVCAGTSVSMLEVTGVRNQVSNAFLYTADGISVDVAGDRNHFNNIFTRDSAGLGVQVAGDQNAFTGVHTWSGDVGGWSLTGDNNMLTGCSSEADNGDGILLTGADYTSITGCKAQDSVTGHGLSVASSDKVTITGGHFINNDATNMRGIDFSGTSTWCVLTGAFLGANGDYNVAIGADADDGVIMGCRMDDAGITGNIDDNSGGTWLIITATDSDPLNELT